MFPVVCVLGGAGGPRDMCAVRGRGQRGGRDPGPQGPGGPPPLRVCGQWPSTLQGMPPYLPCPLPDLVAILWPIFVWVNFEAAEQQCCRSAELILKALIDPWTLYARVSNPNHGFLCLS